MNQLGALLLSVVTFLSTLAITPQNLFPNVLGEQTASNSASTRGTGIQTKKTTIHTLIDTNKTALTIQLEAKKKEVEQKLTTVKDEKKRQVAQAVCDKIASLNGTRTDQLTASITKLSDILTRLQMKSQSVGTNNTSCEALMTTAKTALSNAQSAISSQSTKTYTCTITTESALKTNLSSVYQALQSDLETTRTSVRTAKTTIQNAYKCLATKNPPNSSVPAASPKL